MSLHPDARNQGYHRESLDPGRPLDTAGLSRKQRRAIRFKHELNPRTGKRYANYFKSREHGG